MDDLENGWLENAPDAAWNPTEDVPEWLEEFRATCENLGVERDDPTTRAEAERELRDMAQDVLSGLMAVGSLPVYVVASEGDGDVRIHGVFLHVPAARAWARRLNDRASTGHYYVTKHEVM